jgi:hypothetical protein
LNVLANHKDEVATAEAYRTKKFSDRKKRSYISIAGHEFLRGVDRSQRREEVFQFARGLCAHCGKYRSEHGGYGDMNHTNGNTPKTRCDCFGTVLADGTVCTGVEWICGMRLPYGESCHRQEHRREVGL